MPALEERPTRTGPATGGPGMRLFDPGAGRRLDDLVCMTWDDAAGGQVTSCLVCGADVPPNRGGHVECAACGTVLE
jgi:hypothetical protein